MKKIIFGFLFLLFVFIFNLVFYYFNENYRISIKKVKYGQENFDLNQNQDLFFDEEKKCNCLDENNQTESNQVDILDTNKFLEEEIVIEQEKIEESRVKSIFKEKYSLNEVTYSSNYKMFGITDEYPYSYKTLNNSKFELYVFEKNDYDEIFQLFNYLSSSSNFTINRTNTFGNRSFFINQEISSFVKIIILYNDELFGLNIKKQFYDEIKDLLLQF